MHRRLEERDEVAERFAAEGVDVSDERLEVDEVVVGLHPGLCHLLAQTIESRKIGTLRDLSRKHDVEHSRMKLMLTSERDSACNKDHFRAK